MFRSRTINFASTIISVVILVLLSLSGAFPGFTPTVDAQAQTQLVPLVTDQTPLALSNSFGVPFGAIVNQAGDYAFLGNVSSAVFFRRAGAAAPVRVMQTGDEVPGFPGSRVDFVQTLGLNNSGLLAFNSVFYQANGVRQAIILTFDGTSLQRIVAGNDPAPGGGGANFGDLTLLGLNDSGDVAFLATLVPPLPVLPAQTTLYIMPAGGTPVRVAGLGDTAPGTSGGTFSSLTILSFNNLGEELFRSNINGGSGGLGLFVGSTSGVRKVVATGDANPFGGTFTSVPTTGLLNNAGQVAFQASGALWIDTPPTGISRVVKTGDAAPPPIGGTFVNIQLQAFDDAGDIAFLAVTPGNGGLFRFRPSNPVEVVAYGNQAAAGAPGESFSNFTAISINNTGVISFRATLVGGPILNGIFQQTGSNPPVNIALDGQATTLGGGGAYSVANALTKTLNDGSVYFRSDVVGGTADYAEVLISRAVTTVLMSTADTLPAGARVSLRSFRIGAAGDSVGFLALHTGGRLSIAVHNITNQTTTILATDGEAAPGTGGGHLRITTFNTVFVNASGTVVFGAQVTGGSAPGSTAIFLASPGVGLAKVAANGDVDPGTGRTLSAISLNPVTPSPINDAGQVVFSTTLLPTVPGPSIRAVFVWSPGTGLSKVAAVGDVTSSGGTITNMAPSIPNSSLPINSLWINSSGQVAFLATTAGGPTGVLGIYVGTPGGTPVKVVAAGDPGPAGTTFSGFSLPGFNDSAEVPFVATLTGGPGGGVFIGSTSAPPVPFALNGDAAPAGGNFLITTARPDVLINNQHDVVFRANLTGGTADSGYFVRRGPLGALQAVALQGQAAAGTTGVLETIIPGPNGFVAEAFQLGPAGDLAFQNFFAAGGQRGFGTWHLQSDDTIEEILVRGVVAPEFGGGTAVQAFSSSSWNSGGRFAVFARVSGGTFTDGIFLFVPTVSTNTPAGTAVPVTVTDSTTGTTPVTMIFDSVTVAGDTSLTTSSGGPAIPTAFALGDPPVFYNIETTATFSGFVGVCIDFSNVSFPAGSTLRLLHFQGGVWVDVTTSGPTGNIICGSVTSLSPFAVVRRLNSPPLASAGPDQTKSCGSTPVAPVTLDGSASSDPDHDSLTFEWRDEGNNLVGASAVVNLTVPLGLHTYTLTVNDGHGFTSSDSVNVTVNPRLLAAVGPANVWIGLKNSDDVGTKFDLQVEVFKDGAPVGSGQSYSVAGGSSGFNNAKLRTIPLTLTSSANCCGGTLSVRVSVRVAADSGHRSGTARLWFNDAQANSNFIATIETSANNYFLLDLSKLGTAAGLGPKKTIDVLVDRAVNGNQYKAFGTWTITLP
jgi:hypothetical protein